MELVAKFMVLIVMIVSWVWDTYLQTHYVCIITICQSYFLEVAEKRDNPIVALAKDMN